jgi:hypothetical protein
VIDSLLKLHEAPVATIDATLGYDRTVFIPSIPLTLRELVGALERVTEPGSPLGKVTYKEDPALSALVGSMPTKVDCRRAVALGMGMELDAGERVA